MNVYREQFSAYLNKETPEEEPINLFEPIRYILDLGGKRLRPLLVLMGADIFGNTYKTALDAAMAVEIFHNFSLVHDDIMDEAPLRRGQITVHEKWDVNTGILSGDAMLIKAYQFLERYEAPLFKSLCILFNTTAMQVCKGQQYDVDFEDRDDVTLEEYVLMITYKTSVLVACALKMGAIIGGASADDQDRMYRFGKLIGLAFQLQDDYLDVYGDPEAFGKQTGGDIIENKKTFLYLKALELGSAETTRELTHLYSIKPEVPAEKIGRVKELFTSSGAAEETRKRIHFYTDQAFEELDGLSIGEAEKKSLLEFGTWLLNRSY